MKTTVFSGLLIATSALMITSCGGKNEDMEGTTGEVKTDSVTQEQRLNTQTVFYNVPSPVETSTLLKEVGAEYDVKMVNDPTVYKSYTNEQARALNLGVYGADLSFAGLYENSQESMSFVKCVNSLSNDLGIAGVFDEKTVERLEKNKNDHDSLLDIISKSFWEADAYLKENQRPNTSSLIVTGGWIEGMFIAGKVYESKKHPKIRERIISAPQRTSLKSLIALLESEKQSPESQFVLDGLKALALIYEKIPNIAVASTAKRDEKTGEITIGTESTTVKTDDAVVSEIISSVSQLRDKVVAFK